MKRSPANKTTLFNRSSHIFLPALSVCLASSLTAGAQSTPGTNTVDPEFVSKILQRMEVLEQKAKRVDELEAEVKSLQSGAAVAEPAAPTIRDVWPKVDFQVQGDVDYYYGKGANVQNTHNTFFLGDFDPLITARLSERA